MLPLQSVLLFAYRFPSISDVGCRTRPTRYSCIYCAPSILEGPILDAVLRWGS